MRRLMWFRQDLRIHDNAALTSAALQGDIVPVYILDESPPPLGLPLGGASRWWLHHSLLALRNALGSLVLLRGNPIQLIPELAARVQASGVVWNRCYEPSTVARDSRLKAQLLAAGLEVTSYNSALLFEPWEIKTAAAEPYKVFSPFWRACLSRSIATPRNAPVISTADYQHLGERLESWHLLPEKPNWAGSFAANWSPGETGASEKLATFLQRGLPGYRQLRDYPGSAHVSRLSPHLHWGEISPRRIWSEIQTHRMLHPEVGPDADKFLSELGWREFSHHLLFYFPTLAEQNWKREFDCFPWTNDTQHLAAWRQGRTGYPFVDAGMRELWKTGYVPNRARLVVASFLVKHLRIDWRAGAAWFWDTLLDADLANNAGGWQWVFGSGADAAPYFRIFNPIEQGRKFDPEGTYIRHWCPELARLPNEHIHAPFLAPAQVLRDAGVALGETYPHPIVDHARARQAALEGYELVRKRRAS